MSTDAQPADSSPAELTPAVTTATDKAVVAKDVSAYRAARLAERTGKPSAMTPEDSPSSAPAAPAASTDATPSPASEPGSPSGHKGNLKTRTAELDAEVRELQEKLRLRAQLRDELARSTPAPVPNASPASQPAGPAADEPKIEDFATEPDPYAAWLEAKAERRAQRLIEQALQQEREAVVQARAAEQTSAQAKTFQQRMADERTADPTLEARLRVELFDFVPSSMLPAGTAPTSQSDLAEAVLRAERPAALMAHLSDHPEALSRLLASENPATFWRTFGRMEQELAAPAAPKPQNTVTTVPRPPRTVGTRTEPTDAVEAAVRNDDVASFRAARLQQKLATRR